MAVVRRGTEELAAEVMSELNRPEEDSLFSFPEDYFNALSKAHRYFYRKIAQHAPGLLKVVEVKTSSDGGDSYDLGDHHFGDLEVWAPPGPPKGLVIPPALPESPYLGFYNQGTSIYLTYPKDYSPGLYVRWTPATVADLDTETDHSLPAYVEDAMIYRAAFELAKTPGFLGDPSLYLGLSRAEWSGDPSDPSDTGVMGILSGLDAYGGIASAYGGPDNPWYRGIGN